MVWYATPPDRRIPASARALAKHLRIDETTLYRWRDRPGWNDAVTEIARHNLGRYKPNVYGALLKAAESGDNKAMRLYFELLGDIGPEGKAAQANVAVQLVIAQPAQQDAIGAQPERRMLTIDGGGNDGTADWDGGEAERQGGRERE